MPEAPNFDADTVDDAMRYFTLRSLTLACYGWRFVSAVAIGAMETGTHWGALAEFRNDNHEYRYAIYVLKSRRGAGLLPKYIAARPHLKFITIDDCNVESFYRKHGRDVLVLQRGTDGCRSV